MRRTLVPVSLAITLLATTAFAGDTPPTRTITPATHPSATDPAAREKWFSDLLTNATLAGSYTVGKNKEPREDRYTILKAVKADGDNWTITAKIEYRGFALPLDLTIPVRWAGDTPVIELTDLKVPGFGTFTARVMFYGDQYAGMWNAGDHGGLMWGAVQHGDNPATRPAAAAKEGESKTESGK